eukprot:scaffold98877_cov44-Phaeocystis_antarctica.AAC.2
MSLDWRPPLEARGRRPGGRWEVGGVCARRPLFPSHLRAAVRPGLRDCGPGDVPRDWREHLRSTQCVEYI